MLLVLCGCRAGLAVTPKVLEVDARWSNEEAEGNRVGLAKYHAKVSDADDSMHESNE